MRTVVGVIDKKSPREQVALLCLLSLLGCKKTLNLSAGDKDRYKDDNKGKEEEKEEARKGPADEKQAKSFK